MKKLYILYVGEMVMPNGNAAAQRVTTVSKSLIDLDYKPIIFGLNESEINSDILSTYNVYSGMICYSIKYPKTKKEWIKRIWTIEPIKKILFKYGVENFEAIIAMDFESIPLMKIRKFCKKNKIKLIADNVEWYEKSNLNFPQNIVKNLDTNIRMKYIYPKLNRMICISKYLFNYYNRDNKRVALVPGTVDTNNPKWIKKERYAPNKIFTFIYAGFPGVKFSKERIDLAIKSVCELNSEKIYCNLELIGIDNNTVNKFSPYLQNLEYYNQCINYLGKCSHEETIHKIAQADMSIIIREDRLVTRAGFPTKLSESFACNTPVLSTPSGDVSDYIFNNINGFLTNGFSYEEIKKSMKYIIENANMKTMHCTTSNHNLLRYEIYTKDIEYILGNN